MGSRVVISCELHLGEEDKIQIEVLSGRTGSRPLPADTVYIIKTSGSTGPGQTDGLLVFNIK